MNLYNVATYGIADLYDNKVYARELKMKHYVRRATRFEMWEICSIPTWVDAANTLDYDKIKDTLELLHTAIPILIGAMVVSGLVCFAAPFTSLVKCFLVG